MPAELSLYSLNFIDRILIVRLSGLAEAGLYALAIKFAQGMNVIARGLPARLAAARLLDRRRRRGAPRLQPRVHLVRRASAPSPSPGSGCWPRWIVDLLAAPDFFESYKAVGLLATGIALYALYLVLVVILGRTGRTEFNLPATIAGTVVNVVVNLVADPTAGDRRGRGSRWSRRTSSCWCSCTCSRSASSRCRTSGAGWRSCSSSRRATVAGGELLLPTSGFGGFASRLVLWLALPWCCWRRDSSPTRSAQACGPC